ncbi:MAG: type II toxin-antitoxin system ParD family antitoxin [Thermomicrobiales bacterium]|nr:type II toxin-antitoxin system ParD family antitoxin [Thermomicrobiales bacterium]
MSKTRQLSITLPEEIIIAVHERVASGDYPDESAVILESLLATLDPNAPDDPDPEFEEWIRNESIASYLELRANPASAISAEEVWAKLDQKHAERMAALNG